MELHDVRGSCVPAGGDLAPTDLGSSCSAAGAYPRETHVIVPTKEEGPEAASRYTTDGTTRGRTSRCGGGPPEERSVVRRRASSRRELFWTPVRAADFAADVCTGSTSEEGRLLFGLAGRIDLASAALPSDAELREADGVAAAVYVEGARRSLAIAAASLRCRAASVVADPLAELRAMDPRLAEWLN